MRRICLSPTRHLAGNRRRRRRWQGSFDVDGAFNNTPRGNKATPQSGQPGADGHTYTHAHAHKRWWHSCGTLCALLSTIRPASVLSAGDRSSRRLPVPKLRRRQTPGGGGGGRRGRRRRRRGRPEALPDDRPTTPSRVTSRKNSRGRSASRHYSRRHRRHREEQTRPKISG